MHATELVLAMTPYLPYLAEGASKKLGEKAAESVLALLRLFRARFKRASSTEALTDLEAHPEVEINRKGFGVALEKELIDQPDLIHALVPLLERLRAAAPQLAASQTANVVGDGNTTVQAAGSTVTITR
jgi:hypothetical protein